MAGGKKAKRGGTAKQKRALSERNTAFIETSDNSKRVLPREVRDKIYRYLLLGRNVKKQRDSELWNAKGWAYHYCFEVNILRASKAIYAKVRVEIFPNPPRTPLTCAPTLNSQKSPVWGEHVRCLVDQGAPNLLSFQVSRHSSRL